MWKWIVGILVVVVLIIGGVAWYGYTKLTAGGDSAMVSIAASPARVFASLADPDSMQQWMGEGTTITASHHGILAAGDTLHVEQGSPSSARRQQFTWSVSEVDPERLLVLQMGDTSGKVFATRRDSLVVSGDSTRVITTIASPMMDSIRMVRGDSGGKVRGAAINLTSKILISAFRELSREELLHLKTRLETGASAPAPH